MATILLIDDRKSKLIWLEFWLRRQNLEREIDIVHFEYPEDALPHIKPGIFVLILLDYMFEKYNPTSIKFGDDYLPVIRAKDSAVPIWMFTDNELNEEGIKKLGGNGVFNPEAEEETGIMASEIKKILAIL